MSNSKVNLFLIGAMKAGTTSFSELLGQHEQIYVAPVKEPHFFVDTLPEALYEPSRFFSLDNYLKNDFPEPLHITKIENLLQYNQVFSMAGGASYQLDSSTAYLHAPNTADKIHVYNPEAKILVLLRDPLMRAFSHYKMNLGKGRINKSFNEVMAQDIKAYNEGRLSWYSYLGMSLYDKAIEEYQNLFKDVLVIRFEDIKNKKDEELKKIASFLEIPSFGDVSISHQNIARKPKFPKLLFLLKRLGVKDFFSKVFSSSVRQKIASKISSTEEFTMDLSEEIKNELDLIFNQESKS